MPQEYVYAPLYKKKDLIADTQKNRFNFLVDSVYVCENRIWKYHVDALGERTNISEIWGNNCEKMHQSMLVIEKKWFESGYLIDVSDPISLRKCCAKESNFYFDFSIVLLKSKSTVFFDLTGLCCEHNCKH